MIIMRSKTKYNIFFILKKYELKTK